MPSRSRVSRTKALNCRFLRRCITASTGYPSAARAEPASSQFPRCPATMTSPLPCLKAASSASNPSTVTSRRRTSGKPRRTSVGSVSASRPTCRKQALAVWRTHASSRSGNARASWDSTTRRRKPSRYATAPSAWPSRSLKDGGQRPSEPRARRAMEYSRRWRSRLSGPSLHRALRRRRRRTESRRGDGRRRVVPAVRRVGRARRYVRP